MPCSCARCSCPSPSRRPWMNCIKIGLPGRLILSKRKGLPEGLFSWKLYPRINFPGRPIFIQLAPGIENLFLYCDKCGKRFVKKDLKPHKEVCYDQGNYKCPLCPLAFNTQLKQREHHNKVHSTDEHFKCKYCGFRAGKRARDE